MQLTWHIFVVIAAFLIGVCLFQKSQKNPEMSPEQVKDADMRRMLSYGLFAVSIGLAVYYYSQMEKQRGTMYHYGTMCGKAHMCGIPHV